MNRIALTTLAALTGALSLSALARSAPKGFITGTVTNQQGQPIKGAEVVADNTLAYDSNLIVYTDAKGHYMIDVSMLPTTWNVTAKVHLHHQGEDYSINLVPDNSEVVAGRVGGVRNFTLRPKALTAQDPYGNLGIVNVQKTIGEYDVDESKVTLTLTPVGKLADASTGKTLTVKPIRSGDGWIVPNVMWGTYTVSASLNGQPLEVRKKASGGNMGTWAKSYTGGFVLDYFAVRPTLFIEVRTAHGGAATGPTQPGKVPAAAKAIISGTVSAREVRGTVVFACVRRGDSCDETTIKTAQVTTSGPRAAFSIGGLNPAAQYTIFGWRDMDGDGTVNSGDLLGTYNEDAQATPVSPPHPGTDFSITPMN